MNTLRTLQEPTNGIEIGHVEYCVHIDEVEGVSQSGNPVTKLLFSNERGQQKEMTLMNLHKACLEAAQIKQGDKFVRVYYDRQDGYAQFAIFKDYPVPAKNGQG